MNTPTAGPPRWPQQSPPPPGRPPGGDRRTRVRLIRATLISALTGIVSLLVWSYTDAAATACSSAWVSALSGGACTGPVFWHELSQWTGLAGIAGVAVCLWIAYRIAAGRDRSC